MFNYLRSKTILFSILLVILGALNAYFEVSLDPAVYSGVAFIIAAIIAWLRKQTTAPLDVVAKTDEALLPDNYSSNLVNELREELNKLKEFVMEFSELRAALGTLKENIAVKDSQIDILNAKLSEATKVPDDIATTVTDLVSETAPKA